MKPVSAEEVATLRDLVHLAEMLQVPLLAIGASARQLVFDHRYHIAPHRSTTDWDFAILISDWNAFAHFRSAMIESGHFAGRPTNVHRLYHSQTGIEIDLVPFGGVEQDGCIQWPGTDRRVNVSGFRDAYQCAEQFEIAADLHLRVATVPLIAALKIFAAADRAADTNRDLLDLMHLTTHYPTTHREGEVYELPLAPAAEELDWSYLGSLLLGRDIAAACREDTLDRLIPVVQAFSDPYSLYATKALKRTHDSRQEEQFRHDFASRFRWLCRGIELGRR